MLCVFATGVGENDGMTMQWLSKKGGIHTICVFPFAYVRFYLNQNRGRCYFLSK